MDSVTVEGAEDLSSKPTATVDTGAEPPGVIAPGETLVFVVDAL